MESIVYERETWGFIAMVILRILLDVDALL